MPMDFPSNSQNIVGKSQKKELPKKELTKVVSGEVTQRKKPLGKRVKELLSPKEFKNVMRYVASDVLGPAFKNMVVDATTKGIQQMIYGTSAPVNRGFRDPRTSRVSYNSPVDRHLNRRPSPSSAYNRPRQDIGEIILVSREEAESVIEGLTDVADKYDVASVADLYELVGLPTTHVDNKWGWAGLHDVGIAQVREGYLIDLPPAEPI